MMNVALVDNLVSIETIEATRLNIQGQLDAAKTQIERNKVGQFATPTLLAANILEYAHRLFPSSQKIRFLDPAFGTGAFYTALLRSFDLAQIATAQGYEIDPHYGQIAVKLWGETSLNLQLKDFTQLSPPPSNKDKANLLICNPPYVRHHHLVTAEKQRLQMVAKKGAGIKLGGLTGLYGYFLLLAHEWLADEGLAGWLIPSEFMDVNYGKSLKQYLLQQVTLLHIHRFAVNEVQFGDALVSSAVVWFKKTLPPANLTIKFSYGGSLTEPKIADQIPADTLLQTRKWTSLPLLNQTQVKRPSTALTLSDLFQIKRGVVTGANKFFILTPQNIAKHQLPTAFLKPILSSPRYLLTNVVEADHRGQPILEPRLFLLDCDLPEQEIEANYPKLWRYLLLGQQQKIHQRYLCRHRTPWYIQEHRLAAPLLCTYMGRNTPPNGKPFRFILNYSEAIAPNVYLMLYPKPHLAQKLETEPNLLQTLWQMLNKISPEVLMGEGRVYGGGLHKIEPNELGNVPIAEILDILPDLSGRYVKQLSLF